MLETLAIASFCIAAVGWLVVTMDVLFLVMVRSGFLPRTPVLASLCLISWVLLGVPALWVALGTALPAQKMTVAPLVKSVALWLYLAGSIVYMELRSMLSRGYSLRILIDLLKRGGEADLEILKSSYGGGMGISGLVQKRIQTLSDFHLLHYQGHQVGPLTPWGKILATVGSTFRRILRLEHVG